MSSLAAPVETRPSRSRDLHVDLVAGTLALAALWLILCRHLSSEWSLNEQYNYGWFVPFFALYLFWLRWGDRPQTESRKSKVESKKRLQFAIAVAALVLLLLLPLRLFEIANPDWRPLGWLHAFCVVTLTLALIWYVGGRPWLRHFAFPVGFILVAVPWISPIEQPIVEGLMRLVASAAAEAVSLFGIPAQVQGNLVRLPHGLVGVNEACSGVRSLQTSLMIGLFFGELKRLSILQRIGLVAGAIGIALVANFFRALFLVWIAATRNLSEVDRWHNFAGYGIVALVFLGSLLLANAFAKSGYRLKVNGSRGAEDGGERSENTGLTTDNNEQVTVNSAANHSSIRLPTAYVLTALFWVVAVEFAAAGWYRAHEGNLVAQANWTVRWDELNPPPREIKIAEGVRQTLRFDEGREVVWQTSAPETSSVNYGFFFRWNPGSSSVLRARAHRPDICLPSAGWKQISDRGIEEIFLRANLPLPIRRSTFRNERGFLAHAFFVLQEDRLNPREERPDLRLSNGAQPDWSFVGRCRTVRQGIRNLGQQVLELIILTPAEIDDAGAEQQFVKILNQIVVPTTAASKD